MPNPKPNPSIAEVCADLARYKRLWSYLPVSDPDSQKFLDRGAAAGDLLVTLRANSITEVLLKLSEALDLVAEEPHHAALLASAMTDLQRLDGISDTPDRPAPPVLQPNPKPRQPPRPVIKVDRRARPVTIDGMLFSSIQAASKATGISYEQIRSRSC